MNDFSRTSSITAMPVDIRRQFIKMSSFFQRYRSSNLDAPCSPKAFSAASTALMPKNTLEAKVEAFLAKYCCPISEAAISLVDRQHLFLSMQIFLKRFLSNRC
jgi:hypothetical protein